MKDPNDDRREYPREDRSRWAFLLIFVLVTGVWIAQAKEENFVKPDDSELKNKLSPLQYKVTQEDGTERPFQNEYWDNKQEGIYVDIVSGEPLFSSQDKFKSGTGWPSFTKPLDPKNIVEKSDRKLFMKRTEIRSKKADSHLGHVFSDGPAPTGLRYCMNSASMRFVSVADLEKEGYLEYVQLFSKESKKEKNMTDRTSLEKATLAGGCFWGMEELLRKTPGVVEVVAGYAGGSLKNPTYSDVKTGKTGHAESVQVLFDPSKVSYEDILVKFFKIHDPTTENRQGGDVGTQYRSAIFFHDAEQEKVALAVKARAEKSGAWDGEIVTEIVSAEGFDLAEDFHQDYLQKNPGGYTCHFERKIEF